MKTKLDNLYYSLVLYNLRITRITILNFFPSVFGRSVILSHLDLAIDFVRHYFKPIKDESNK